MKKLVLVAALLVVLLAGCSASGNGKLASGTYWTGVEQQNAANNAATSQKVMTALEQRLHGTLDQQGYIDFTC
jgi:hypothetical protein